MFRRREMSMVFWLCLLSCLIGCGRSSESASSTANKPNVTKVDAPKLLGMPKLENGSAGTAHRTQSRPVSADSLGPKLPTDRSFAGRAAKPEPPTRLVQTGVDRPRIDDAKVKAAGIRKLTSKRLTLYTDLPRSEAVDTLPEIVDQAFPQWCEYFKIDRSKNLNWHLTGFLMRDPERFQKSGLISEQLPSFQHGYSIDFNFWVHDQPSDYYRRHLVLHEATHSFMNTLLGACGPPWYMEGVAELLGTHRWKDGRLMLNYMPANRTEVPMWGRVRIVRNAKAAGQRGQLQKVIQYRPFAHREVEPYAWCWTLATLLDRHPKYRTRFRQLYKHVLDRDFNQHFQHLFKDDWQDLSRQWQLLVNGLEYGHDIGRTAVDFAQGKPLTTSERTVVISSDRGWQNTGVELQQGSKYQLQASGRYKLGNEPKIWWCEPGGISIDYYRGRPLGILLAAIEPSDAAGEGTALLEPIVVGLGTTITPKKSSTLFLKINDSPAKLADNDGKLTVKIRRL